MRTHYLTNNNEIFQNAAADLLQLNLRLIEQGHALITQNIRVLLNNYNIEINQENLNQFNKICSEFGLDLGGLFNEVLKEEQRKVVQYNAPKESDIDLEKKLYDVYSEIAIQINSINDEEIVAIIKEELYSYIQHQMLSDEAFPNQFIEKLISAAANNKADNNNFELVKTKVSNALSIYKKNQESRLTQIYFQIENQVPEISNKDALNLVDSYWGYEILSEQAMTNPSFPSLFLDHIRNVAINSGSYNIFKLPLVIYAIKTALQQYRIFLKSEEIAKTITCDDSEKTLLHEIYQNFAQRIYNIESFEIADIISSNLSRLLTEHMTKDPNFPDVFVRKLVEKARMENYDVDIIDDVSAKVSNALTIHKQLRESEQIIANNNEYDPYIGLDQIINDFVLLQPKTKSESQNIIIKHTKLKSEHFSKSNEIGKTYFENIKKVAAHLFSINLVFAQAMSGVLKYFDLAFSQLNLETNVKIEEVESEVDLDDLVQKLALLNTDKPKDKKFIKTAEIKEVLMKNSYACSDENIAYLNSQCNIIGIVTEIQIVDKFVPKVKTEITEKEFISLGMIITRIDKSVNLSDEFVKNSIRGKWYSTEPAALKNLLDKVAYLMAEQNYDLDVFFKVTGAIEKLIPKVSLVEDDTKQAIKRKASWREEVSPNKAIAPDYERQ